MITAGCDIGSLTTKAVILNNTRVIAFAVAKSHYDPVVGVTEVMNKVLKSAGVEMKDIGFCVGTGYGRERIPFAQKAVSEISCHAKGAQWLMPSVRTIIDGVNFTFEKGKFYVVTGPNGSGKTTLAKLIMGINPVTTGDILFDGKNINGLWTG